MNAVCGRRRICFESVLCRKGVEMLIELIFFSLKVSSFSVNMVACLFSDTQSTRKEISPVKLNSVQETYGKISSI